MEGLKEEITKFTNLLSGMYKKNFEKVDPLESVSELYLLISTFILNVALKNKSKHWYFYYTGHSTNDGNFYLKNDSNNKITFPMFASIIFDSI